MIGHTGFETLVIFITICDICYLITNFFWKSKQPGANSEIETVRELVPDLVANMGFDQSDLNDVVSEIFRSGILDRLANRDDYDEYDDYRDYDDDFLDFLNKTKVD